MTKKASSFHPKSILASKRGIIVGQEDGASLLLDQWNEKHIEILRDKFQEVTAAAAATIAKQKNANSESLMAQGLDKQAFLKVFADLKTFPKQVAESAFRLFDRDRSGFIDFREFCCGLSIICLSSTNEKIRFVFDLFDLDRDGYLNIVELKTLLETSVMSFRKFCKGPTEDIDKQWIEHHLKLIASVSQNSQQQQQQQSDEISLRQLQQQQSGVPTTQSRIDFFTFKLWAEKNLNVYHLLNTFMLVPSPVRERKEITEILTQYERKHGDTMYAVSLRWWETWKDYTGQHQSAKDQSQYVELIKQSLAEQNEAPEVIRNFLMPYYEEQKEADLNEVMQRQDLLMTTEYGASPDHFGTIGIKREYSRANFSPPRSELGTPKQQQPQAINDFENVDNSLSLLNETLRGGLSIYSVKKQGALSQLNAMIKLKEQQYMSKRSLNYSQQPSLTQVDQINGLTQSSHVIRDQKASEGKVNHLKKHSAILIPGSESPINQASFNNNQSNHNISRKHSLNKIQGTATNPNQKILRKQLSRQEQPFADQVSSHPSMIVEEDDDKMQGYFTSQSEMPINQSFKQQYLNRQNTANMLAATTIQRPSEIDNSDIEGEHHGQLKPNLILHRDFIMIPEKAWILLLKWYGGGPIFPRKVLINNMVPTIELYPPLINSVLAGTDGNPIQDSARSLFVSIAMKLSEVFLKVCESFNYISTKDARLWFKQAGNQWVLISKLELEKTLEDFIVKDGDVFMVEMRFGETWPRDATSSSQGTRKKGGADWRNFFEVGDRLDVNDNNEWKIGIIQRVIKDDNLIIHLLNEHWKNDLVLKKNSELIDRYGIHTLEMHFKNTNSLKKDEIPLDFTGLDNIGNTCYINAVLQSLFHTPLFKDFFLSNAYKEHLNIKSDSKQDKQFLAQAFGDLIAETVVQTQQQKSAAQSLSQERKFASIAPIAFKKLVNQELPMFFGSQQHDSQEFLNFFLDKLSEDLNRAQAIIPQKAQEAKPQENNQNSVPKVNQDNQNAAQDGGTGSQIQDLAVKNEQSQNSNSEIINQDQVQLNERSMQDSTVQVSQIAAPFHRPLLLTTNEQIYHQYFQPGEVTPKQNNNSPQRDREGPGSMIKSANSSNQLQAALHSANLLLQNQKFNISPLLLDPSLTEGERKSIEAWQKELKLQCSAISDLFVGQQGTTVQCQKCKTKSYAFENFYTLSLPLPHNPNAIFYVTVMKRSSPYIITPVVKYGIQIDKNAKLSDLMKEIERLSQLKESRMIVTEVCNNKIYRVHSTREEDGTSTPINNPIQQGLQINLKQIYRRTNELTVFETFGKINEVPAKTGESLKKSLPQRTLQKPFKSLTEIQIGAILDAQDSCGKWYVGIVIDRNFDFSNQEYSIKVHFFEFPDRWDEWFKESDSLNKIAPFGTHAEEPKDKIITMPMIHRKKVVLGDATLMQQQVPNDSKNQFQTFGTPFYLSLGNWQTWDELYEETIIQTQRYIRHQKQGNASKGGISSCIPASHDNILIQEDPNTPQDYLDNKNVLIQDLQNSLQDKSFSRKMQDGNQFAINEQADLALDYQMMKNDQAAKTQDQRKEIKRAAFANHRKELFISQTPDLQDMERRVGENGLTSQTLFGRMGNLKNRYSNQTAQVLKSFNEKLLVQGLSPSNGIQLPLVGDQASFETQRLPFTVSILDGETHLCAICLFKSKFMSEKKGDEMPQQVTCKGCDVYQSGDKIKWILSCFKRLEICVDWHDASLYKNPLVTSDITCLQYLHQEKELQSGIPLQKCFDILTDKEQIDDYRCDNCKANTPAIVDTKISRAPDILIIHLKRFAYQSGYLEKIEDLVTFPINNLDITNYQSSGFKRQKGTVGPQKSYQYDLYAVVNHIMYHNSGGGHYTSYVMSETSNKKQDLWLKCNDSGISRIEKTDLISKDAYILFYKRKEFSTSNIINFTAPPGF